VEALLRVPARGPAPHSVEPLRHVYARVRHSERPSGNEVVFLSFLSVCERAFDGREDLKLSCPGVFVVVVPVGMVQERKLLVCSLNLGKGGVDLYIQQTIKFDDDVVYWYLIQ